MILYYQLYEIMILLNYSSAQYIHHSQLIQSHRCAESYEPLRWIVRLISLQIISVLFVSGILHTTILFSGERRT